MSNKYGVIQQREAQQQQHDAPIVMALVFESANDKRRIVAGSRVGMPFTQYAAKCKGIVPMETLAAEVVK